MSIIGPPLLLVNAQGQPALESSPEPTARTKAGDVLSTHDPAFQHGTVR